MKKTIISETITIKNQKLDSIEIEKYLKENFGEIIRWAIVEIKNDIMQISLSYEN